MALILPYECNGAELAAAYIRVIRIWGSPEEDVNALVGIWAKKAARNNGKPPLDTFNWACAWDNTPIAAVYASIKADPRFAAATDD
jgi:hypothetical protein